MSGILNGDGMEGAVKITVIATDFRPDARRGRGSRPPGSSPSPPRTGSRLFRDASEKYLDAEET